MTSVLEGRRILVIEDDYFLAMELTQALRAEGAQVVGPAASVDDALDLIETTDQLDGAVVDINLQGEMAYPIAEALIAAGIRFVFSTGYDRSTIPDCYSDRPLCRKPTKVGAVIQTLFG